MPEGKNNHRQRNEKKSYNIHVVKIIQQRIWMEIVLNKNFVAVLNTGFKLQRYAYKVSQEPLNKGSSNLQVQMI